MGSDAEGARAGAECGQAVRLAKVLPNFIAGVARKRRRLLGSPRAAPYGFAVQAGAAASIWLRSW